MIDLTHLDALRSQLVKLEALRFVPKNKKADKQEIIAVWIEQKKREIASEYKFLGIEENILEISDEDLLKELGV